jgi:hypothetical protein
MRAVSPMTRRPLPDANEVLSKQRDYWLNARSHLYGPRHHTLRKHVERARELAHFSVEMDPAKVAELAAAMQEVVADLQQVIAELEPPDA